MDEETKQVNHCKDCIFALDTTDDWEEGWWECLLREIVTQPWWFACRHFETKEEALRRAVGIPREAAGREE